MRADLTPKRQAFVQAYVRLGGLNGTQAAIAAGYSGAGNGAGAAVTASRLLRDPRVKAAVDESMGYAVAVGAAVGADVLTRLAQDAADEGVRLTAATRLLQLVGALPSDAAQAPAPKPEARQAPAPDALRDALRKLLDAPCLGTLTQDPAHAAIVLVDRAELRATLELVP